MAFYFEVRYYFFNQVKFMFFYATEKETQQ